MRAIALACAAIVCAATSVFAQRAEAPPIAAAGRVVDSQGAPVPGAAISVAGGARRATSDPQGRFQIEAPIGATLAIDASGFQTGLATVTGSKLDDVALLADVEGDETIEISSEAPATSAAQPPSTISGEQIRTMAGVRGDAIEAIRNLPSVAFASSGQGSTGDLAIRGTSGSDSWYLVDGIAVPAAMHLGGVTAILPVELIQSIDLHPGGFDVQYGRATGGVVELATRRGRADQWRAAGELSFVHATAYAEGPVWRDRATLIAGVRRSFLDLVLPAVIPDDAGVSFTEAPVYSDAQLRLDVALAPRHHVTVLGMYSDDRVAVALDQESANDPAFTGFGSTERFWRASTSWRYDGERLGARAIAAIGTDRETLAFGAAHSMALAALALTGRLDLRIDAAPWLTARAGLDAQRTAFDIAGRLPVRLGEGQPDVNLTLDPALELDTEVTQPIVAGYAAADARPIEGLSVTAGVRVERYGIIDDDVIQPRISGELALDRWRLRGSLGRFSRTHDTAKTIADQLRAERATQATVGIEHRAGDGIRLGATLFASWLDRLAVYDAMRATDDDPIAGYVSRGTGTARGVEVMAQLRRDDLFGWVAYTFSQSRRIEGPGMPERRFDQDQPHNLVAAASWRRGRWRFGARFRFASGIPDTPVVGSVYVADRDVYRPIHGATNSARLPSTHQLDLRIDREIVRAPLRLSAYLDVANAYANPRVSGYAYDFDYRNREPITELPLTPSIGVRGEL